MRPSPLSKRITASITIGLCLFGGFCAVRGENWPCFRGPSHQGASLEANLPLHWNAGSNVLWKTAIPRLGWSSPIVWGERVFLTSSPEDGKELHLLCLDATTGKVLWNRAALAQDPVRKDEGNSWATPTPVTDGRHVYVVSFNGAFAAVDFGGNVVWTNLETKFYLKHGLAASPLLEAGILVMPCDGTSTGPDAYLGWQKPWDGSYVIALDADTGKVRWKTGRGRSRVAFSSPNAALVDGGFQVVSVAGDVVQGFDLRTGERIWTAESFGEGPTPSAVVGGGVVFSASGWNTGGPEKPMAIRAFRLGGRGDVSKTHLVWEQPKGQPKVPSFVYVDPYLFVVEETGGLECLQSGTGEIVWKTKLSGRHEPSPVLADGRLYLLSSSGRTTVIEAGGAFKKLSENPLEEKCGASMAVSGQRLFIRGENSLFCIGRR